MARETNEEGVLVFILSLIFPGLGHYYAGFETQALWWIVAIVIYYIAAFLLSLVVVGFFLFLLAPLVHIACAADVMFRV